MLVFFSKEKFEEISTRAQKNNQKIEDLLLFEKIISEEELVKIKSYILGIPYIDLAQVKVPLDILKIIPEPIARSHNIVAFRKKGDDLEVAMLDPEDLQTIEFLKKTTTLRILPRLTTIEGIKNILRQYQKSLEAEFNDLIKKEAGGIKTIKEGTTDEFPMKEEGDLKKMAEDMPIIKIVDTLLRHAILQRASDIHIEPTEKEVIVRYRIDGVLHDAMILPQIAAPGIVARIKVLSNLRLDEHRLPQDGRFKIETDEYKYSVRVSILPVVDGEKIVMRLLSESSRALTLEMVGLRSKALEDIQYALKKPTGMILITGPTGSGKTTTLYSMMEILNHPGVNISTIEDPVEYRMPRINQTQINTKIGLTFANGLRSLLRQDPNIIMVGEIRDNETASLAINAALTGHLVLSTLHTNSASGAIPRLIDMKCEPFLITSTINIILAQRLVRKLTNEKEKYFLSKDQLNNISRYCDLAKMLNLLKKEKIIAENSDWKDIAFYRPIPSRESPTGYKGRVGIFEVLPITTTIKEMIQKNATADEIQRQAQKEGMVTIFEDGFIKAAMGITSFEEVLRVIIE